MTAFTPLLLALQLMATFTFANGAKVEVSRDSLSAEPVVLHVSQGTRSATQRLTPRTADSWAYLISWASQVGVDPFVPDTVSAWARTLSAFSTTVSCGKGGCKASILNVTLWGSTYAYLRPGPLPHAECRRLAQALWHAGGYAAVGEPPWPYSWHQ